MNLINAMQTLRKEPTRKTCDFDDDQLVMIFLGKVEVCDEELTHILTSVHGREVLEDLVTMDERMKAIPRKELKNIQKAVRKRLGL